MYTIQSYDSHSYGFHWMKHVAHRFRILLLIVLWGGMMCLMLAHIHSTTQWSVYGSHTTSETIGQVFHYIILIRLKVRFFGIIPTHDLQIKWAPFSWRCILRNIVAVCCVYADMMPSNKYNCKYMIFIAILLAVLALPVSITICIYFFVCPLKLQQSSQFSIHVMAFQRNTDFSCFIAPLSIIWSSSPHTSTLIYTVHTHIHI